MTEEKPEVKPRLILDGDPFKADKFASCDDCMNPVPEGTIMRKALPSYQTQKTDNFTSLDGRELSTDLRWNICPKCVVLNDMKREPRSNPNVKDPLYTHKAPGLNDKQKSRIKKRKMRGILPEE